MSDFRVIDQNESSTSNVNVLSENQNEDRNLTNCEKTPRRSQRISILYATHIPEPNENHSEEEDESHQHKHLIEPLEEHVDGKAVYGFHTPKKRQGMASIAASVSTPKTPRSSNFETNQTPKRYSSYNHIELPMKTPKHIRRQVKKGIVNVFFIKILFKGFFYSRNF